MPFRHLETKTQPVAPTHKFVGRVFKCFLITNLVVAASMLLGTLGYRHLGGLEWLDAVMNAAMILTGMGPVTPMTTAAGKLFATAYALFSGIVFLSLVVILLTPVYHRFLHRFHLEPDEEAPDE